MVVVVLLVVLLVVLEGCVAQPRARVYTKQQAKAYLESELPLCPYSFRKT